jgi:hypothetical protein
VGTFTSFLRHDAGTLRAIRLTPFCFLSRRGQVLLATVNEATMVPFVSQQLNNLDLALALAKRGNLPGAEGLVGQQFERLFQSGQYKEAAEAAAESPQVSLNISWWRTWRLTIMTLFTCPGQESIDRLGRGAVGGLGTEEIWGISRSFRVLRPDRCFLLRCCLFRTR